MDRMDRINQQMKRELGTILQQDLSDPRLQFVSITAVNVSRDLRSAKVYFSVLGEPHQESIIHEILDKAGGFIRKLISQRLNLRNTPAFSFYYDKSIAFSDQLEETLKEIHDEEDTSNDQEE